MFDLNDKLKEIIEDKGFSYDQIVDKKDEFVLILEPTIKLLYEIIDSETELRLINSKDVRIGLLLTLEYNFNQDEINHSLINYDSNGNVSCEGIGYFIEKLRKELRLSEYDLLVSIDSIVKELRQYRGNEKGFKTLK